MPLPSLIASLPMPAAMRPTAVLVRALNAVLRREPWAQTRLAQYVGRTVTLSIGALELPLSFTYAGTLVLIESEDSSDTATPQADVQLTIPTHRLKEFPALLAQKVPNPDDLLALVHIEGDAGLAHGIAQVVSQLRLDPEAELARFTGDVFAVRSMALLKQLIATGQRTAKHAEGNLAEFLGEESGLLVSTDYAPLWENRSMQLKQRLQALEQRIQQLEIKGA